MPGSGSRCARRRTRSKPDEFPESRVAARRSAQQSGTKAGSRGGGAVDWDDEDPPVHRLSAAEAQQYRDQRTAPSPWRVVLMQVEVGAVISLLCAIGFQLPGLWSALYGAATAVIPGALMARGATR